MKRRLLLLVTMIISCSLCTIVCACNRHKYTEGESEAKNIVSYLQETNCLGDLALWKTRANKESIEICFTGDCELKEVLSTTKRANQYLDTHPESVLLEKDMSFRILFFPEGSDERDWERLRYFACVEKESQGKQLDFLEIHSTETIKISEFRNCKTSLKTIVATYNVFFDDPEALLTIDGLSSFVFYDGFISTDTQSLLNALQSVCYYEDNMLLPDGFGFTFSLSQNTSNFEELKNVYNDFVKSHPDYQVFSEME